MNVVLDATPLTVATGGTGRYTLELSRALAATFPEDEFTLISDQRFSAPPDAPANLSSARPPEGFLRRRWWSLGLPRELSRRQADVFHGTDFSTPYLPLKPAVLTLHDLSPWKDRGWHRAADRVRRRTPFLLSLGLATMVITQTEAVRREAVTSFRLHPSRVVAVPLAASEHFRPRAPGGPDPCPYFLFVGTLEPRKNVGAILSAWREIRKRHDVDLVLAGRRRADFPEVAPERGLRVIGETAEEDLPGLYSQAVACLYPSLYEGFGLPVLEAMQCGAAVLASRDPAILEVSGGAAVSLEARDVRAWVEAMRAALTQPDWLSGWRDRALRRAADFSWPRTARLTRAVYVEAIRRFRR